MGDNRNYDVLKDLLKKECDYVPLPETLDALLALGKRVELASREALINSGTTDSSFYIIESGIIRFTDFNGDQERTWAFGLPGTMFTSRFSFVMGMPSYYDVLACCPSSVLRVTHADYNSLLETSGDFTRWMLRIAQTELFYQEFKNSAINNGSAKERFIALCQERPEIIRNVPQKVVASYLGISPEYFCRLRRTWHF